MIAALHYAVGLILKQREISLFQCSVFWPWWHPYKCIPDDGIFRVEGLIWTKATLSSHVRKKLNKLLLFFYAKHYNTCCVSFLFFFSFHVCVGMVFMLKYIWMCVCGGVHIWWIHMHVDTCRLVLAFILHSLCIIRQGHSIKPRAPRFGKTH